MNTRTYSLKLIEFEYRIFISLGIVVMTLGLCYLVCPSSTSISVSLGQIAGINESSALKAGYYLASLIVLFASLLRMWAGSVLTSATVMSFSVQDSMLKKEGPYLLVRNPIYLADLLAFWSFTLLLPPVGLIMPLLILLHYRQLISYEEERFEKQFPDEYKQYLESAPRLIPGLKWNKGSGKNSPRFFINRDGFRHNAQYILLIPGFIVAAHTGKLYHAILIGLPAIIDWAVVHTLIGLKPEKKKKQLLDKSRSRALRESRVFSDLLYAQGWEDPRPDFISMDIKDGDSIFTITSGGCNALAYLSKNPGKIICLDMNDSQNYLLELKIAAFRTLDHAELLKFLGVRHSEDRTADYQKMKKYLSPEATDYWDLNQDKIIKGLIHSGRYEKYMALLKRFFYLLIGKKAAMKLFTIPDRERTNFYNKYWNNFRYRLFTRILLSRKLMVILFDKRFYSFLEPGFDFNKYYRGAVKRAVTQLPVRNNNFLSYILTGTYTDESLPVYLREENYRLIRNRLDRIKIVHSGCIDYLSKLPEGTIDKFNFTNIFEWMSPEEYRKHLEASYRAGKDASIIIYRNHLVTRRRPDDMKDKIIPDRKLSKELHSQDLSFIYRDYIVEKIKKS